MRIFGFLQDPGHVPDDWLAGQIQRIDNPTGDPLSIGGLNIQSHHAVADHDSVTGNNFGNVISGSEGADTIFGLDGDDLLSGDEGADSLDGGLGNVRVYGDEGNDIVIGGAGTDYLSGGDGDDSLLGDDGADILEDGQGNDTVQGGAGNDIFLFSGGVDQWDGGNDIDSADFDNFGAAIQVDLTAVDKVMTRDAPMARAALPRAPSSSEQAL